MAIRVRGGLKADFDPNKMLPREMAIPTDTQEVFAAFAPGVVKRMATKEDMQVLLNASPTAYEALITLVTELNNDSSLSTTILSSLADKLDKTGDSKDNTVTITTAVVDSDIVANDKHSTIIGKVIKRFATLATNIASKINTTSITQTDVANDATKIPSSVVTYAHGQSIATLNNNLALKATLSSTHAYKTTTSTTLKDITESGFYRIDTIGKFSDYPTALGSAQYGIVEVSVCGNYKAFCISATDGDVTVSKTTYGFSIANTAIVWGTAV